MTVRIRFSRLVISPVYGNCAPGSIVACGADFARHCVEDLGAAEYLAAPAAPAGAGAPAPAPAPIPEEPAPDEPTPKRRTRRT